MNLIRMKKKTKLEKLIDAIFPLWLQRLSLLVCVLLIVLEIFYPDIMTGWDKLLLWVVIPYTVISFWLSGYFIGLIHSGKENSNKGNTNNE